MTDLALRTCRHASPAVPVEVAGELEPVNWLCPDCGGELPKPIDRIDNPYWDIVSKNPGDDITMKYDKRWVPAGHPPIDMLRRSDRRGYDEWVAEFGRSGLVVKYSWAIPDPLTLGWIVAALDGRPVVEVGAGTGYWAWLLSQLGVDIVAYDLKPPIEGENGYHCRDGAPGTHYFDIQKVDAAQALAIPDNRDRVLFMCWPPYNKTMASEALAAFQGDTLIEIGEGDYGCTGDSAFYEALAKDWIEVDVGPLTSWSGLHDRITMWSRRA